MTLHACLRCQAVLRAGRRVTPWSCRQCRRHFCEHQVHFRDVNATGLCARCQRAIAAAFQADAARRRDTP